MRTVLIVVDGMRPDAIAAMPRVQKLLKNASYTMTATTVMPSVTLRAICRFSTVWTHLDMGRRPIHMRRR